MRTDAKIATGDTATSEHMTARGVTDLIAVTDSGDGTRSAIAMEVHNAHPHTASVTDTAV
jgi:hypothetical protein